MTFLVKPMLYHCAGPSCPGYSFKASEFPHPPSCAKPLPTPEDELENVLRASVAREEKRKMAHEDLYAAIEKRRGELLESLELKRAEREQLNKSIKADQDALDALPVPRTRKTFKGRKPRTPAFVGADPGEGVDLDPDAARQSLVQP